MNVPGTVPLGRIVEMTVGAVRAVFVPAYNMLEVTNTAGLTTTKVPGAVPLGGIVETTVGVDTAPSAPV